MKIGLLGNSHLADVLKELLSAHEVSKNIENSEYVIIAYDIEDKNMKVDLTELSKGLKSIKKSKIRAPIIVLSQVYF